jgi:hypothetical protein
MKTKWILIIFVVTCIAAAAYGANRWHQGRSVLEGSEKMATTNGNPTSSSDQQTPPADWATYVNSTSGFRLDYPQRFVIRPEDRSRFTMFTPTPVASLFFMNPTMATGALAGIEPPDLNVRIYRVESVDSLKNWLASVGLATVDNGATVEPYRSGDVNGLRVCQATMVAPGCSVYVLHRGRVYQLTPSSQEGQAIMKTLVLLP